MSKQVTIVLSVGESSVVTAAARRTLHCTATTRLPTEVSTTIIADIFGKVIHKTKQNKCKEYPYSQRNICKMKGHLLSM